MVGAGADLRGYARHEPPPPLAAAPRTVAEAFLAALAERGVEWVFGNAGTDFAPVIEALAANAEGPLTMPKAAEILHETVATSMAQLAVYPEGAAARSVTMPLSAVDPAPDYPKFIEAYGGHGEHVDDPAELHPALERAVDICRSGRQALVSVHVSYPDAAIH